MVDIVYGVKRASYLRKYKMKIYTHTNRNDSLTGLADTDSSNELCYLVNRGKSYSRTAQDTRERST